MTGTDPQEVDLVSLAKELAKTTHTPFVLISSAILEDWLAEAIKQRMRPISNTVSERIFGGQAPLRSFSAKIDVAYAFGVINEPTHNDMRVIKDIRNEFAHATSQRNFTSSEVITIMRRFSSWNDYSRPKNVFETAMLNCARALKGRGMPAPSRGKEEL